MPPQYCGSDVIPAFDVFGAVVAADLGLVALRKEERDTEPGCPHGCTSRASFFVPAAVIMASAIYGLAANHVCRRVLDSRARSRRRAAVSGAGRRARGEPR